MSFYFKPVSGQNLEICYITRLLRYLERSEIVYILFRSNSHIFSSNYIRNRPTDKVVQGYLAPSAEV